MKTHIRESTWLQGCDLFERGWGNGYVILDKGHPWEGMDYDNISVNVHGGLTFGRYVEEDDIKSWGLSNEDVGKYMIGFDTAHYGDNLTQWPKDAVQEEANNLLRQCHVNNIIEL